MSSLSFAMALPPSALNVSQHVLSMGVSPRAIGFGRSAISGGAHEGWNDANHARQQEGERPSTTRSAACQTREHRAKRPYSNSTRVLIAIAPISTLRLASTAA